MRRPAFTLLELLIVITIMGVMAAAILLNFSGARERQQLSLLADKSAAMLQVAQEEVRSGKLQIDTGAYLCEGALFEVGTQPLFLESAYDSSAGTCEAGVEGQDYGLDTLPAVVYGITVGSVPVSELYALYSPPNAGLAFYDQLGTIYSGDVQVSFSSNGTDEYGVTLQLSSLTGLATLKLSDEN